MKFSEIREDSTTLASRTIRNYARELGPDSMDYGMFMRSAELLDKGMLKSLAQLIDKSDTAPREYVMKKIADHDPETFKKLYGDQEGYLSVMKPVQDLKDAEDNTDRGMNKYGLAARQKDGKFYSYRHGKLTGTFDNIQDLQKHQQELIQKESAVQEDAPFDGMGLVRMALMRKFITAQEWHGLQHKWKDAVEELEQRYDDWPEDQGFGSSDHAYAIKELMELVGYEFDDQDTSGRFVVSKMPPELEKAGIKNARMKDAVATEDAGEDKDVEKAKQIAKDKAGDMTGASQDIDKVKKGLTKHPDVADALKRANEELNRITKLAGLEEGASMLPYFKQDEKTWAFPDAWQKDEALDTPYMSNMSMREFLDGLGYDSNFEDAGPVDAKEFIARTTQWLQKNIDKPSQEIPTTVDKSGGGATMYTGGKPEGWMNRQVKHHNELARKILAKYPEVTHFGFN